MATKMAPAHQVDRGFTWLVLAVSFFMFCLSAIAPFCGVYVAAMIDGYHTNRAEGYIAGALSIGFFYVSGPIASVVMDKSNPRTVGLVGSSIATIGLLLSANVPSIFHLYATFSITDGNPHEAKVSEMSDDSPSVGDAGLNVDQNVQIQHGTSEKLLDDDVVGGSWSS